jgi:hypothetical protein
VVSSAGAQGLMQLMPATARAMGVTNVWDPRQNIMGGARYLQLLARRYCRSPAEGLEGKMTGLVCSFDERIKVLAEDELICSTDIWATTGKINEEGVGVLEAPRGTLFHHYWVDKSGMIKKVNLIVATGNNNAAMNRAVFEVAKKYVNGNKLTEGMLNRVEAAIRCYDPCLSCSTHALGSMPLMVQLVSPSGEVLDTARTA